MAELLRELGRGSLEIYWLPVALWSVLAMVVYLSLRAKRGSSVFQYHGRASLLLALPVGLAASVFFTYLHEAMVTARSELSAKFIIIRNPISFSHADAEPSAAAAPGWSDPQVLIGLLLCLLLAGAVVSLVKVLLEWNSLRRFASSLRTRPLTRYYRPGLKGFSLIRRVRLAFSPATDIPFTFGWFNPVVVLPGTFRNSREKQHMAIKHELIHIRHGDFALNGFLLIVRALFWFHPLVHLLQREVEEYREISCDREVISGGSVSPRQYAELLFELAPKKVFRSDMPINMAVPSHLLKKRISVMKSHESAPRSHRSSQILTVVTVFFVIGLMACTGLQRTGTGGEEQPGEQITLMNATIEIDGLPFMDDNAPGLTLEGPVSGIALLTLGEFGTFIFSGYPFEGAVPEARIEGNRLEWTSGSHTLVIRSEKNILSHAENAGLWILHEPGFTGQGDSSGARTIHSYWAADPVQYETYREMNLADSSPDGAGVETEDYFLAVEESPVLIGGIQALQDQLDYPEQAIRNGIEGVVIVQFIVTAEGRVENPAVIRGIGGGCDEAAVAAVRRSEFEPGRQRGQAVPVQFALPINFSL